MGKHIAKSNPVDMHARAGQTIRDKEKDGHHVHHEEAHLPKDCSARHWRGAGFTFTRCDDPCPDGAGRYGGRSEASICGLLCVPRHGPWLLGPGEGRRPGRRSSFQLEASRTLRKADRDYERVAFPVGGTASGRDRRRPLGCVRVPVREQTQEDRRRRHLRREPPSIRSSRKRSDRKT